MSKEAPTLTVGGDAIGSKSKTKIGNAGGDGRGCHIHYVMVVKKKMDMRHMIKNRPACPRRQG